MHDFLRQTTILNYFTRVPNVRLPDHFFLVVGQGHEIIPVILTDHSTATDAIAVAPLDQMETVVTD